MASSTLPDPTFLRWPINTSEEYIAARRALLKKEYSLSQKVEAVAEERRALPPGPILPPYVFEEGCKDLDSNTAAKQITLVEIAKETTKPLVVYHMMMGENDKAACSGCSMFLDSINGTAKHLAQRINLVVVAKAPIDAIRAYAKRREWHHLRFLSSSHNTFNKDMNVEAPEWMPEMAQVPGFTVFTYDAGDDGNDGAVRFWYHTNPMFGRDGEGENMVIRGMDLLTPVWNVFDLTPEGRGEEELEYPDK